MRLERGTLVSAFGLVKHRRRAEAQAAELLQEPLP
jgi:hypothetical protein